MPNIIHAQEKTECEGLEEIFQMEISADSGHCKVQLIRDQFDVTLLGHLVSAETLDLSFRFVFEKTDNTWISLGEMALLEDEVNVVINELRKGNIEITAIHNHFFREHPRIIFLHFQSSGDLFEMATIIQNAIEKTAK